MVKKREKRVIRKKKLLEYRFFKDPFWNLNVYVLTGAILIGLLLAVVGALYSIQSATKYEKMCIPFSGKNFSHEQLVTIDKISNKTYELMAKGNDDWVSFLYQQPCVSTVIKLSDNAFIVNFTNNKYLLLTDKDHLDQSLSDVMKK